MVAPSPDPDPAPLPTDATTDDADALAAVEVDVLEDDVSGAILTLWLLLWRIGSLGMLLLLQLGPGESGGE